MEPLHRGRGAVLVVLALSVLATILLLVVANPVGHALTALGVPTAIIAIGMIVAVSVLSGAPIAAFVVHRSAVRSRAGDAQEQALQAWARAVRWNPVPPAAGSPTILARIRAISTRATASFAASDGSGARMDLWEQTFSNLGSPVKAHVQFLTVTLGGAPAQVRFGIGRDSSSGTSGSGLGAVLLPKWPGHWANTLPVELMRVKAHHPWGSRRVAVWPMQSTPAPPVLGEAARALEHLGGWALVLDGRIEVSARLDDAVVSPQLIAAAAGELQRALAR